MTYAYENDLQEAREKCARLLYERMLIDFIEKQDFEGIVSFVKTRAPRNFHPNLLATVLEQIMNKPMILTQEQCHLLQQNIELEQLK